MSKIHYATGGLITPEKAEFSTLCGRKFPKGGRDILDSGYAGAKRVTCEDCREKLDWQERKHKFYEELDILVRKARGSERLTKSLMRNSELARDMFLIKTGQL